MLRSILLGSALITMPAHISHAQPAPLIILPANLSGTRLDIVATGEVERTPDIAQISAGVVTQAARADDAMQQNSARMSRILTALRRAGIAERDIQTSSISLHPEYRYAENQPPMLVGYRASNDVSVTFREIAASGRIIDALILEGANQISGPNLIIDKREEGRDEARRIAVQNANARADLYASATGKKVKRIISISETEGMLPPQPLIVMERAMTEDSSTKIVPGVQKLTVSIAVAYELE